MPQTLLESLGLERGPSWRRQSGSRLLLGLTLWTCLSQDGKFSFPLESVKKLKGLQELQEPSIASRRQFDGPVAPALCSYPKFPEELKPVCKEPNAHEILRRLEAIAEDPSTCELCAYAACAGC